MKHLTILVPEGDGNNLSSIVGVYKIFSRANEYRRSAGRQEVFRISLAGLSRQVDYYGGLFAVKPQVTLQAVKRTDLIIIPSLNHNFREAIRKNSAAIDWIRIRYAEGAEVASICTGAFLLASTGLLDGKSCSTHWSAAETFRMMFPRVKLKADKLITDENGICTNGGAYSFLNLVLYLVQKFYDRETAVYCSKVFQIEMDRNSQSEFAMLTAQKLHGDEVVKKAQALIESRLGEKISVEELSSKFSVGRRNFDRRFVKATGSTPLEYAQRVRVEAAKRSLESSRKTVHEVMHDVGYADVKAFRQVFRKFTGMSPLQYRGKYNKDAFAY
jgi:transcriptional regulator GlxA family with amidase domain